MVAEDARLSRTDTLLRTRPRTLVLAWNFIWVSAGAVKVELVTIRRHALLPEAPTLGTPSLVKTLSMPSAFPIAESVIAQPNEVV